MIDEISADISAIVEVAVRKFIMKLQVAFQVIPCSGLLKLSGIRSPQNIISVSYKL